MLLLCCALGLMGLERLRPGPLGDTADSVGTGSIADVRRLDLNSRADRVQLMQLPGLGETLATRVEANRDAHTGFREVEECCARFMASGRR